jgi:hypothetical protein
MYQYFWGSSSNRGILTMTTALVYTGNSWWKRFEHVMYDVLELLICIFPTGYKGQRPFQNQFVITPAIKYEEIITVRGELSLH